MDRQTKREHGDRLMARILDGGNDKAANKLLTEFLRGYPIEKLRLLIHADKESACRTGAWLASELGTMIKPLISELSVCLDHPSRYVRFFVIDAILNGANKEDGEALAKAVLSILDSDKGVRWKSLKFLSKASYEQLVSALPHLQRSDVADLLAWLLNCESKQDTQSVINRLSDTDNVSRMFAAAASVRIYPHNPVALERAAASSDLEVRAFAQEELASSNLPSE